MLITAARLYPLTAMFFENTQRNRRVIISVTGLFNSTRGTRVRSCFRVTEKYQTRVYDITYDAYGIFRKRTRKFNTSTTRHALVKRFELCSRDDDDVVSSDVFNNVVVRSSSSYSAHAAVVVVTTYYKPKKT